MENMSLIKKIIDTKSNLELQLKMALSTMEKKDDIRKIYQQIEANQMRCPHQGDSQYNFTWVDDTCPYCGKKCVRK